MQESTSSITSKTYGYQRRLISQQLLLAPVPLPGFVAHIGTCAPCQLSLETGLKEYFITVVRESWRVCVLKGWLPMFVLSITAGHPHVLYIRRKACHWVLLTFLKVSLLHLALGNRETFLLEVFKYPTVRCFTVNFCLCSSIKFTLNLPFAR